MQEEKQTIDIDTSGPGAEIELRTQAIGHGRLIGLTDRNGEIHGVSSRHLPQGNRRYRSQGGQFFHGNFPIKNTAFVFGYLSPASVEKLHCFGSSYRENNSTSACSPQSIGSTSAIRCGSPLQ